MTQKIKVYETINADGENNAWTENMTSEIEIASINRSKKIENKMIGKDKRSDEFTVVQQ